LQSPKKLTLEEDLLLLTFDTFGVGLTHSMYAVELDVFQITMQKQGFWDMRHNKQ
jgi:hypothetical protein